MLIDREKFLRAALLMSLGGAPIAGCFVVPEDEAAGQSYESSGGEQQPVQAQPVQQHPVQQQSVGQPVMVRTGPVYEGGGPAYEGSPVVEGGPAVEGGAPVYE